MEDTDATLASVPSSASEQARLRKQRREAKIKAGGSARLNRILGESSFRNTDNANDDASDPPISVPDASTAPSPHYYVPTSTARTPQSLDSTPPSQLRDGLQASDHAALDAQMRSMLQGLLPGGMPGAQMPMPSGDPSEDPMMAMLSGLLGGQGGATGAGTGLGGNNPFAAFSGGQAAQSTEQQAASARQERIWQALHLLTSLALALYFVFASSYTGTRAERRSSELDAQNPLPGGISLFWWFAGIQFLLQSSRFVLEKGRPPAGSWLSMIGMQLPQPFGGLLITVARYNFILSALWSDGLLVIFILGVATWWKGG